MYNPNLEFGSNLYNLVDDLTEEEKLNFYQNRVNSLENQTNNGMTIDDMVNTSLRNMDPAFYEKFDASDINQPNALTEQYGPVNVNEVPVGTYPLASPNIHGEDNILNGIASSADNKLPGINVPGQNQGWYPGKNLAKVFNALAGGIESHGENWYPGKHVGNLAKGTANVAKGTFNVGKSILGKAMEGIDTLINADFMSKGANSGGNWFPTTSELEDWKNRNSMDSSRPSNNIVPNNNIASQNDLSTMPFGSQERINEYNARGWAMDETTHPNIREDYGIPEDDPIHYINPDLDPSINPEAGYQDPNNVSGISSVDEALSTQEYTNNVAQGDSTLANNILQQAYENDGITPGELTYDDYVAMEVARYKEQLRNNTNNEFSNIMSPEEWESDELYRRSPGANQPLVDTGMTRRDYWLSQQAKKDPSINPEAGYEAPNAIPFSGYNAPFDNPNPFRTGVSAMPTFPYTNNLGDTYYSPEDFFNQGIPGPGTPLHNQMLKKQLNTTALPPNILKGPQPNPQIKYNAEKQALEDELIKLYLDNLGQ